MDPSQTKEIFERIAMHYDNDQRIEQANTAVEEISLVLENTDDKDALDYGCGTGLVGLPLAEHFKSMLLVDPAQNMIDIVNKKIEANGIKNARAIVANYTQQAPSTKVDYIFMVQTLIHIPETEAILSILFDTLKDNGRLIIVDFDKNELIQSDLVHNGFYQNELGATLKSTGFTYVDSHTFHQAENLFMGQPASVFILDAMK